MSSASILVPALDAKFRGEYTTLAALTTAAPTPNIGDTATIIDATALGYPSEFANVFWNGSGWVVVERELIAANNWATPYADASRNAISSTTPSGDNIAGVLEFVSSRTASVRVRQGRAQVEVLRVGTYIAKSNANTSLPFDTLTLIQGDSLGYNTMGATTALAPLGITVPIANTYQFCSNWWGPAITTTSAGRFFVGRAQNGVASGGGAGQTQYFNAGVTIPATPPGIRSSVTQMATVPAGTIFGVALYQDIFSGTFNYSGNLSVGLRQE